MLCWVWILLLLSLASANYRHQNPLALHTLYYGNLLCFLQWVLHFQLIDQMFSFYTCPMSSSRFSDQIQGGGQELSTVLFNLAAAAKSLQSCPTLCDPIDGSPPGSPVPGILQARTLEWVALSFSNAWKWKVEVKSLSSARLLATPWTAAHQAPLSMGFSRHEYWSGVPLPSPSVQS